MFWKLKIHNQRGSNAEDQALAFLLEAGLILRARNYACKTGEIDLIMHDGMQIVFVEVRFRKNRSFGSAEESIHFAKRNRLCKTAQHYLQAVGLTERAPCRFDTITVHSEAVPENGSRINWLKNAFGP